MKKTITNRTSSIMRVLKYVAISLDLAVPPSIVYLSATNNLEDNRPLLLAGVILMFLIATFILGAVTLGEKLYSPTPKMAK